MTHPILEAPAAAADRQIRGRNLRCPSLFRDWSSYGFVPLLGALFLLMAALPCVAQESEGAEESENGSRSMDDGSFENVKLDRPGSVDAASVNGASKNSGAVAENTQPLTRAEEWRLGIEIRRSADWNLQDLERREIMERLLGRDRLRRLEGARFQFQLRDGDPLFDHDLHDLAGMDEAEDTVLSAYSKLAREALEDVLGLEKLEERSERWLDRVRSSRRTEPRVESDRSRTRSAPSTSYRVRVSPRFADDYVGVKLRMPYTGSHFWNHLSFRVRYDFDEDRTLYMLKFDDNQRFLHFTYEPDTEEAGDELSLSLRFFW